MIGGRKATGPGEEKNWFFPLGRRLKVNLVGFAITIPLDSQVAKAQGILETRGISSQRVFLFGDKICFTEKTIERVP